MLLVDFMLVASGGVLIFRKDFIAIYLSILLIILNVSTMSDLNLLMVILDTGILIGRYNSHPTTGYLDSRCYRELRSYLRHTE